MVFTHPEYIYFFLPLSFFIYFFLLNKRLIIGAKGFLIFASLFFYSWWNIAYLPLILISILFNYVIGTSLNETHKYIKVHKKTLLIFGISANLALLGYYKYFDFFIENFNLAFDTSIPLEHLLLPLAISFFTFQQIAYLVDSYRKETAEYYFLNYALFVTFFPQLIAGPIVHHSEMIPQFASRWNLVKNYKNITRGLFIFSIGLFKKVVIADYLATIATRGFENAEALTLASAWATSLAYTFQIYFDFSGYTDMAIGAALLFNIKLPINFNSPYKSTNIQDFWRRWHITLSRFLKDYIYIPLGGNRKGNFQTYNNLLVTFILGGLWHGAAWTFIFWGFLHGIALIIHRLWKKVGLNMPKVLAWFITFNFINITWVFFRAKEWEDAIKILHTMFLGEFALSKKYTLIFYTDTTLANISTRIGLFKEDIWLFIALIIVILFKNSTEIALKKAMRFSKITIFSILFIYWYTFIFQSETTEFLYFNF